MVEVVASSLLKFVSDQLTSKALSEFALVTGADKELKKLEGTLSTIQDVLEDAETRQAKEKALRNWLRKLRVWAYDADDVIDDFAIKAAKLKPANVTDMKEKVRNFLSIPKNAVFRRKIGLRVKEINERLDEIAAERSKFHLKEGALGSSFKLENRSTRVETGSFINESEIYGRKDDKEKIVELVMNNSSIHGQKISVIGIVGLGGLGKTTLAQLVYNDERICEHFENKMWVCVSEDFEMRRLVGLILEPVTGRESWSMNMDIMELSLTTHLKEKRFLLVLDDVWSESHEKWDKLWALLSVGANGSKVIVTTRSERVASIMGTIPPYHLSTLSLDDCTLLFERRAFGGAVERNPNLVEIGREIVKKCGGVPLAAKALGSLLRFKRSESGWQAIKDSELWKLSSGENCDILPALKLSYDHLTSYLKQCFAYCSIFPKGFEIYTDTLVRLWESEGFLKPHDGLMDLKQNGLQYIDELLERSLFQKSENTGAAMGRIKMHDLVHDLAQSVAGNECLIVHAGSERQISESPRYASFICNTKSLSSASQWMCDAKKLRTFYLHAPSEEIKEEVTKANEVLHVISTNLKLLRALHLCRYPLKGLPDSFRKLKHLRYLNLSDTPLDTFPPIISTLQNLQTLNLSHSEIKSIPDSIRNLHNLSVLDLGYCLNLSSLPSSIGELKHLQELDVSRSQIKSLPESICALSNLHTLGLRNCYFIHELPRNMSSMKGLVHLNMHGCIALTCVPKELGKLSKLRSMSIYIAGGKTNCSIAELGSLKLEGELHIKNLLDVRTVDDAKEVHLNEKHRIHSLKLSWKPISQLNDDDKEDEDDDDKEDEDDDDDHYDYEDIIAKIQHAEGVLQNLQPNKNLRELEIEGYLGITFPGWMMEASMQNLVSLTLSSCACEKVPPLGQLPLLGVLNLVSLPLIKHLSSDFYGGPNAFPSLKELELRDMEALEEWINAEEGEFLPRLHKLTLQDCPQLKALPSDFSSVTTLKMNVDDKLILSSLQSGAFPNLTHLNIQNYDDDVSIPDVLTERFESLTSWSVGSIFKPSSDDPKSMSSLCFAFMDVKFEEGENTIELPLHF